MDCARPVDEAIEIARAVLVALDVVGVLCVEFFVTRDGSLWINELAPRPHNSGHLTFDASLTSQFEQQLRAGNTGDNAGGSRDGVNAGRHGCQRFTLGDRHTYRSQ